MCAAVLQVDILTWDSQSQRLAVSDGAAVSLWYGHRIRTESRMPLVIHCSTVSGSPGQADTWHALLDCRDLGATKDTAGDSVPALTVCCGHQQLARITAVAFHESSPMLVQSLLPAGTSMHCS
jgi:hypothetical protein